jgi:hypothetical protein
MNTQIRPTSITKRTGEEQMPDILLNIFHTLHTSGRKAGTYVYDAADS